MRRILAGLFLVCPLSSAALAQQPLPGYLEPHCCGPGPVIPVPESGYGCLSPGLSFGYTCWSLGPPCGYSCWGQMVPQGCPCHHELHLTPPPAQQRGPEVSPPAPAK